MDPNYMTRPLEFPEDSFSGIKQDFNPNKQDRNKIFQDYNPGNFSHTSDHMFDYGKPLFDSYHTQGDDHQSGNDQDHHQQRHTGTHEDFSGYHINQSYNNMGLPHPNSNQYNQSQGFGYNGVKHQPFQQEHPAFSGYRGQQYYYQNQYETPGNHMGHGNGMDYSHRAREFIDTRNDEPSGLKGTSEALKNLPINGNYNMDPNSRMRGNHGFMNFEQANDPRNYQNNYGYDPKRGQMPKMQPDLQMLANRKVLEPQLKGMNMLVPGNGMEARNQLPKPMGAAAKYNAKVSPKKISPNTKIDAFFDDENGDIDDGYGEEKGRSTRGLRVLSLKVKEIVSQKKRTSYKDVAEALTFELRQKMSSKPQKEESKDEQNVKRRVYDALNVLIAADVLRKEGKVVFCDESQAHIGGNTRRKIKEDKEKLLADIQAAKKRNKENVEKLHELIFKCLAIKNLIKTNKERLEKEGSVPTSRPRSVNATKIEVVQENPSLSKNEDVIRFPFIVLLSSSAENSMNLNMDTLQRQLAIESKKPFHIFGDIDVLLKMGLHYVPRQMFEESIPKELQKYVPKYFLANLK